MFSALDALSSALLAARLLRESILAAPLPPPQRRSVQRRIRASNTAAPLTDEAVRIALEIGRESDVPVVTPRHLEALAAACGDGSLRRGPGRPFHGRAAPPRRGVRALVTETLETVNGPIALDSWSPVVRAFALHFLLRLVQPFSCDPGALGLAVEAALLAADGYDADQLLLPAAHAVGSPVDGHPDPDTFAAARADGLVEALGRTQDIVREATARCLLSAWVGDREAGLGDRQSEFLRFLAERPDVRVTFDEYARLHAGRRAPSLRSLQRDWKGLRDAGWLVPAPAPPEGPGSASASTTGGGADATPEGRPEDGAVRLSTEPLAYDGGLSS